MVGFPLLAFSIVLGAVGADYALSGYWGYCQAQGGVTLSSRISERG